MSNCNHYWVNSGSTFKKAAKQVCLHCKTPRPDPEQAKITFQPKIFDGIGGTLNLDQPKMFHVEHHFDPMEKQWYKDPNGIFCFNTQGDKHYITAQQLLQYINQDQIIETHNKEIQ